MNNAPLSYDKNLSLVWFLLYRQLIMATIYYKRMAETNLMLKRIYKRLLCLITVNGLRSQNSLLGWFQVSSHIFLLFNTGSLTLLCHLHMSSPHHKNIKILRVYLVWENISCFDFLFSKLITKIPHYFHFVHCFQDFVKETK